MHLSVIIKQQNDLLGCRNAIYYYNNNQDNLGNLILTCLFLCLISKTMTDSITNTADQAALPEPLEYPRGFLEPIGENDLSDEAAAACLWQYRRDRPRRGDVDVPADGAIMLKEIKAMRDRLRKYIRTHFIDKARQVARDVGLLMACGNRIVSPLDFKNALCSLESTSENHLLVFKCCHAFDKPRTWLASTLDNWFTEENMVLLDASNDRSRRNYICSRGGFGNVARQAKAQAVQSLMQPMLQTANWYIATTNNLRASKTKLYEKNNVHYDEDTNVLHHFYVVSKIEESRGGGNANEDRQLVEVSSWDFHGMASLLTHRLQVTVSEDALKSVFSQTHSLRCNLSGTTMVLVQNEESMTTMTSESNNCTTSVRNMAQDDPVQHSASYNVGTTSLHGENGNYDINHDNDMWDDNVEDNSTIQQLGDQPNTSVADVMRPPTPQNQEDRTVSPPIMDPQADRIIHNNTTITLIPNTRTAQQPTTQPTTAQPPAEPQVAQPSPITQPQVRLNNNPPTNPTVNLDKHNTTPQPPTIPQVYPNVSMTTYIYM
jgi:hypothetical protein